MDETLKSSMMIILGLVCILIAFLVFFCPTIIAFNREHHYKWIILGINLIFGATGIGYLVAFAWAVWPRQTAMVDLVKNDPTDNSLEACKQYYQKRGEIDRVYDHARYSSNQINQSSKVVSTQQTLVTQPITVPVQISADGQPTKTCPFCGEDIRAKAIKCKHCQSMLNDFEQKG
ncbi:MAG: superinfection immunity protein [bacterium]